MPILAVVKRPVRARILRRSRGKDARERGEAKGAPEADELEELELEKEELYAIGAPAC